MNSVGLIIYHASDAQKTAEFFKTLLGVEPYAQHPGYIGFKVGEMEIGIVPHAGAAPLAYVTVPDIKAAIETLVAGGSKVLQEVKDVGYGLLVASLTDPDGTPVGLRQFPSRPTE